MIAALERLSQTYGHSSLPKQVAAFGISGGVGSGLKRLLMSHPPLEERIAALRNAQPDAGAVRQVRRIGQQRLDPPRRLVEDVDAVTDQRVDLGRQMVPQGPDQILGVAVGVGDAEAVGRIGDVVSLIKAIADIGQLDNTLIFLVYGDNGTSAEGGRNGMFSEMTYFNGVQDLGLRVVEHA